MPMSIPIHTRSPTWPGFHCLLFYPSTHHPSTCLPTCLPNSSLHPGLLAPHPNCPLLFLVVFFYPSVHSLFLTSTHQHSLSTIRHPPPPPAIHCPPFHPSTFPYSCSPLHLTTCPLLHSSNQQLFLPTTSQFVHMCPILSTAFLSYVNL